MRPHLTASRKLNVLVTGAGGLIGGDLVGRLLDRGHGVVGLVHRRPEISRNNGRRVPAKGWAGACRPGEASHVSGDVALPGFGLEPAEARRLAAAVDVVVHCAGVTGFDLQAEVYQSVNVEGARNVVAFAQESARRPGVLHVSTAYVCGRRSGSIAEAPVDGAQDFTNLYEASKAAAEAVVLEARKRGVRSAIARPSIVTGSWANGAIGRFDHLYGLMKLVAEGRITVLPAAPDATLDLVPIDHVTEGLADMVDGFEAFEGCVAHLASGQPTPLSALVDLGEDFPNLVPPHFVAPQAFDRSALRPSEQRLYDRAAAVYAAYLEHNPRFEVQALRRRSGRVCPPLGRPYLKRLVDYAVAQGLVRPPGQRTSG